MASLTPPLQQLQLQRHLSGSAVSATTSATSGDADAFKRNTDCVYFLASPLTCKKGTECEYRHSEIARLNPRDCYYWMNVNCLNPKCGFRHPPLEGLLGAPASQAASTPVAAPPASFGSGPGPGKQPVPCIFFQKGYCMKGDWCPFLHAPLNTFSNKVIPSQAPTTTTTTSEPLTLKKPFGGPEKITQQKMPQQVNVPKAIIELSPTKDETRKRNSGITTCVDNGTQVKWSSRVQQQQQQPVSLYDKDVEEEISREPSPGFDVLVDNEVEDSVYYPNEDQFGRPDNHTGDYKSMVNNTEPDNIYNHKGQYDWERRNGTRSPDPVHDSDLRYRLSKHSRSSSGLRSAIHRDDATHERRPEHHGSYQKSRDHERQDNSLGNRLRGRIKMPERFSSDNGNELQRGRNTEWQRPQNGHNDYRSNRRFYFAGPKRLSELKSQHVDYQTLDGKRKFSKGEEEYTQDLSFDGPKPLEEILKRKKVNKKEDSGFRSCSDGNIYNKMEESVMNHADKADEQTENETDKDEIEGGEMIVEDGEVGGDEDYYEQVDGEEEEAYELDEGNNGGVLEGNYLDEDVDDDDFAKKMGVMY